MVTSADGLVEKWVLIGNLDFSEFGARRASTQTRRGYLLSKVVTIGPGTYLVLRCLGGLVCSLIRRAPR